RHLDIEKQHVDIVRAQEGERLFGVGRRPRDRDAAGCLEQPLQPLHRQFLVVDDVDAHQTLAWAVGLGAWGSAVSALSRTSRGTSMQTAVRACSHATVNEAVSPNNIFKRR